MVIILTCGRKEDNVKLNKNKHKNKNKTENLVLYDSINIFIFNLI